MSEKGPITFDYMLGMVDAALDPNDKEEEESINRVDEGLTIIRQGDIRREKIGEIVSKDTSKTYRFGYDKRVVTPERITYPYGYAESSGDGGGTFPHRGEGEDGDVG